MYLLNLLNDKCCNIGTAQEHSNQSQSRCSTHIAPLIYQTYIATLPLSSTKPTLPHCTSRLPNKHYHIAPLVYQTNITTLHLSSTNEFIYLTKNSIREWRKMAILLSYGGTFSRLEYNPLSHSQHLFSFSVSWETSARYCPLPFNIVNCIVIVNLYFAQVLTIHQWILLVIRLLQVYFL